ncbi:MAG: CBS domain-containing protein [Solirubrobacterales bacterium]
MTRSLEFLAPDATIRDAAVLMGDLDVGSLPVGAANDLQGIITDRDILLRVVAEGREPGRVRVREAMSTTLFTCRADDSLETAIDMMGAYHVRRLPVMDEAGVMVGWLTLSDVSRRLLLDSGAVRDALAGLSEAPADDLGAPPGPPAARA